MVSRIITESATAQRGDAGERREEAVRAQAESDTQHRAGADHATRARRIAERCCQANAKLSLAWALPAY